MQAFSGISSSVLCPHLGHSSVDLSSSFPEDAVIGLPRFDGLFILVHPAFLQHPRNSLDKALAEASGVPIGLPNGCVRVPIGDGSGKSPRRFFNSPLPKGGKRDTIIGLVRTSTHAPGTERCRSGRTGSPGK